MDGAAFFEELARRWAAESITTGSELNALRGFRSDDEEPFTASILADGRTVVTSSSWEMVFRIDTERPEEINAAFSGRLTEIAMLVLLDAQKGWERISLSLVERSRLSKMRDDYGRSDRHRGDDLGQKV